MKTTTLLTILFMAVSALASGCKRSAVSRLRGNYFNQWGPKATLKITADTMICSSSNFQSAIKYRVIAVRSNIVTTEISVPPSTTKVAVDIQVLDDALVVTNNMLYGGNWKRQR